eukprot:366163-Chlamydomonas_euryale.AAC.8
MNATGGGTHQQSDASEHVHTNDQTKRGAEVSPRMPQASVGFAYIQLSCMCCCICPVLPASHAKSVPAPPHSCMPGAPVGGARQPAAEHAARQQWHLPLHCVQSGQPPHGDRQRRPHSAHLGPTDMRSGAQRVQVCALASPPPF